MLSAYLLNALQALVSLAEAIIPFLGELSTILLN